MEILAGIMIVIFILAIVSKADRSRNYGNYRQYKRYNYPKYEQPKAPPIYEQPDCTNQQDYTNGYKSKWILTYNEKGIYYKIKTITDSMNLTLFAKVRLFDLVEPKEGIQNRKGHQWKIQAKHVDFVICDQKLVARAVIELDDASHDTASRAERDTFVDTVLTNCGYKVFHIRNVEPDKLKQELGTVFKPVSANL